jgi:DNA modification methylase
MLMLGDCLERMGEIRDGGVDLILCDLPYGTTECYWDSVIPFAALWEGYWRVLKRDGACVLFGSQPFTSHLNMSQIDYYRYEIIWEKTLGSNFMNANKMPIKKHETISVFYREVPTYNPQKTSGVPYVDRRVDDKGRYKNGIHGDLPPKTMIYNDGDRFPISVIKFPNPNNNRVHPTQKPVALLEYLIKTFTNEGEVVLDNCMGSGSTGVACFRCGREFIGIEKDEWFFNIAKKRIEGDDTTEYEIEVDTSMYEELEF